MKWLRWFHAHPNPDEARRAREKAARADVIEHQARAAIAHSHQSRGLIERVVKENHLAPRIAGAFREKR